MIFCLFQHTERNNVINEIKPRDLTFNVIEVPYGHVGKSRESQRHLVLRSVSTFEPGDESKSFPTLVQQSVGRNEGLRRPFIIRRFQ